MRLNRLQQEPRGRGAFLAFMWIVLVTFFCIQIASCKPQQVRGVRQKPRPEGTPDAERFRKPNAIPELRAVWMTNVDSQVLLSKESVKEAMERLSRLNFTTVYPVVWNKGYTLYPSPLLKQVVGAEVMPSPAGLEGRDLIKEMIAHGNRLDLDVVPWFEYGFKIPANSEIVRKHPQWLSANVKGATTLSQDGVPIAYLNPFHPEVQNFIFQLVSEVVLRYPVPGIQFDDHFSLKKDFGYDAYTRAQYMASTGSQPPTDVDDARWVQWRADRLTEFVGRLSTRLRTLKPGLRISVSPNPAGFAKKEYLQDWVAWRDRGYVQEIVVQIYRDDATAFRNETAKPEMRGGSVAAAAAGIKAGLRGKPVPAARIREQVQTARAQKLSGVSFFFYESLLNFPAPGETPASRESLLSQIFAQPARAP